MTANGQEAVWDGGRRFRRRRSRPLLLGVAVIMAILGIMVFAGAAMAAPSAGDKYPGISNNAQGSSSLLTATIGRELPQEPSRHATALGAQKTMAAAGTGSISGKVTNSSGTGLLGVEVDLYDSDFDLVDYTYTNSSGTYSFSLLPNISVLVGAQIAGIWGAVFGLPVAAVISIMANYFIDLRAISEIEEVDLDTVVADILAADPNATPEEVMAEAADQAEATLEASREEQASRPTKPVSKGYSKRTRTVK